MKNDLKRKLATYSSLGGTMMLMASKTEAQIIYTDPPDITLSVNSSYDLDLNNDGIAELTFINSAYPGSIYITDQNSLEGVKWLGYVYAFLYDIPPYPLKAGAVIRKRPPVNSSFAGWFSGGVFGGDNFCGSGYSLWTGKNNRYMGIRFHETNHPNQLHYGWIRLSVSNDCTTLVIKDWAYNSVPNYPITAGQTMRLENGNDLMFEPTGLDALSIYTNNHQLYIGGNINNLPLEIRLFNVNGQKITSAKSSDTETRIALDNMPSGVYIVQLKSSTEAIAKKIVIE